MTFFRGTGAVDAATAASELVLSADLARSTGAASIGFSPTGTIASTTVQTAIAEVASESAQSTTLAATGGAALIGFSPTGTIASSTVQTAIAEVASESAQNTTLAATSGATLIGATGGSWTTVQGFITAVLASTGATLLGWIQTGTGAISRTIASKFYDTISIADFGGSSGASAATNTTALQNAITRAVALGKGGVDIGPGGTWALTAGTNFASRDIAIIGVGKPILDYSSGTGKAFLLDAGGAGSYIRGMRIKNFIIKGGASITNIFEHRGIVGSIFEDIEVREGTDVGFELRFGVLNTYKNLRCSNDSLAMTTTPLYSYRLRNDAGFTITASISTTTMTVTVTSDVLGAGQTITGASVTAGTVIVSQLTGATGSTGTYSVNNSQTVGSESMTIGSAHRMQANTFINADASGKGATSTSTGFKLDDATLNVFKGGTAESLLRGIDVGSACRVNTFEGTDLEGNVNEDIVDAGTGTIFNGVSSAGGGINAGTQLTGHGATFTGGAYAIINLGAASTDTTCTGVGISSAGGFTGTGPYQRFGCYTLDTSGLRNGTLSDYFGQIISSIGPVGAPNIKGTANIVPITGAATPLFSISFSGIWIVRDNTSGGIAFGTIDPGTAVVTVISNAITATVAFTIVSGILNANTTAGTANRNMACFSIATSGG